MLITFIYERALLNFLHTVDVVVAAAYDTDYRFALNLVAERIESGNRQRASRLRHNCILIVQIEHGRTYLAFRYGHNLIQQIFADGECQIANAFDSCAVNEFIDLAKCNDFPCFE
ncbi:hypothetical protein D3C78_1346080 [compost metagenome]